MMTYLLIFLWWGIGVALGLATMWLVSSGPRTRGDALLLIWCGLLGPLVLPLLLLCCLLWLCDDWLNQPLWKRDREGGGERE